MRPYQFKLEAVRRVRELDRDELRGKLAEAFLAAEKLTAEANRLEVETAETIVRQQKLSRQSPLPVDRLLAAQRYEQLLKTQLMDIHQKSKLVEQEIDRRREVLVHAEQAVKVLETLDDRGRERHRAEIIRQEQAELDEMAGVLAMRNRSLLQSLPASGRRKPSG